MEFSLGYTLWLREVKRFFRLKSRFIGTMGMPLFFLVFLGMAPIRLPNNPEGSYISFLAPGIIGMILLFASMGAGMSVLWDKEFGFLKEVLVAPISRVSVVLGKALGAATVALLQGLVILLLAPLIDIPISLKTLLTLLPLMFLLAVAMGSLGILLATRIRSMEAFQAVTQMLMFPMVFLSGVFFPLEGIPSWMGVLVRLNPVTYGIAPIRQVLLGVAPEEAFIINIFGHAMTTGDNIAVLAVFAVVMILLAMWSFGHQQ